MSADKDMKEGSEVTWQLVVAPHGHLYPTQLRVVDCERAGSGDRARPRLLALVTVR